MTSFCDVVRSEMCSDFSPNEWTIYPDGQHVCVAVSEHFECRFAIDSRDRAVAFTIAYVDAHDDFNEALQSHVLAKLYPNLQWLEQASPSSMEHNVAIAVRNLKGLLQAIRDGNISPRDSYYFQQGYNTGYTDFASF